MAFFQDKKPSREPFLNVPASILWLIGIILAAHAARVLVPVQWSREILFTYAFIPARYSFGGEALGFPPAGLFEQAIPFVSYMFLHADFAHVAINTLWLLAFGPAAIRRLGTVRFLLFFTLCGIAAAVAHLAVSPGSALPVVGASGAIAGLMAAGIRILYGRRNFVFGDRPALAPILSRPILFFTAIWTVVNIVVGLTGLGMGQAPALIAWVAHLGGYYTGLLTIGLFDARRGADTA